MNEGSESNSEGLERYLAYFRNVKTVILPYIRNLKRVQKIGKNTRVLVHSAEVGDAFRPVSFPLFVYYAANAISISYVIYEVIHSYQSSYKHTQDTKYSSIIASKTLTFEVTSSLILPAVMIHTAVHTSESIIHKLFDENNSFVKKLEMNQSSKFSTYNFLKSIKSYGPTAIGLICVPFLPLIFDGPVEKLVDNIYEKIFPNEMSRLYSMKHQK